MCKPHPAGSKPPFHRLLTQRPLANDLTSQSGLPEWWVVMVTVPAL